MQRPTEADLLGSGLLSSLDQDDLSSLSRRLVKVEFGRGHILHEVGDIIRHTYMPLHGAMASFVAWADSDIGVEAALIGREGAIGGIVSDGEAPAFCRARVQFDGLFLSIETAVLEEAKAERPPLRRLFARYSDCLLAQVSQSVACNARHSIAQRTAKWLLFALERIGGRVVPITQEQLAELLGVGRSFVNRVLRRFVAAGILHSRRGLFVIENVAALQRIACGCNHRLEQHFRDVLGGWSEAPDDGKPV